MMCIIGLAETSKLNVFIVIWLDSTFCFSQKGSYKRFYDATAILVQSSQQVESKKDCFRPLENLMAQ